MYGAVRCGAVCVCMITEHLVCNINVCIRDTNKAIISIELESIKYFHMERGARLLFVRIRFIVRRLFLIHFWKMASRYDPAGFQVN